MPYLGWFCLVSKNYTWVSLILCTIRDSVNGKDITIFCHHFVLFTGVPFVCNELILEEKVQIHLLTEVHFIYYSQKIFATKRCQKADTTEDLVYIYIKHLINIEQPDIYIRLEVLTLEL